MQLSRAQLVLASGEVKGHHHSLQLARDTPSWAPPVGHPVLERCKPAWAPTVTPVMIHDSTYYIGLMDYEGGGRIYEGEGRRVLNKISELAAQRHAALAIQDRWQVALQQQRWLFAFLPSGCFACSVVAVLFVWMLLCSLWRFSVFCYVLPFLS